MAPLAWIAFALHVLSSQLPPGLTEQCSCAPPGPPCDGFFQADTVFSGTVMDITVDQRPYPSRPRLDGPPAPPGGAPAPPPPPPLSWFRKKVTIHVDQAWRGGVAGDVVVYTGMGNGNCGFPFEEGRKYLVYGVRRNEQLHTGTCYRTRAFTDADDDLRYFEALKKPAFGGRIFGKAMIGDAPAASFKVSLGNETGSWSTRTDADGGFSFPNRQPGKYGIGIEVPAELRVAAGAYLVELLDPRACAYTEYRLVADASVSLTVLDSEGKAAVRTTLELIAAETLADEHPRAVRAGTQADGSVYWSRVVPGRYVIGMNVTRAPDPKNPRGTLFYPGVEDPAAAFVFEVGAGERVGLDTFRLPRALSRVSVTGVVHRADGTPVRGADVILRSAHEVTRGHLAARPVRTDTEGRFSLPGLAGQDYFIDVWLGVEGELRERYAQTDDFRARAAMPPLVIGKQEQGGHRARPDSR